MTCPAVSQIVNSIQIFIFISALIIWNIIGLVFLMKYLSKILKAQINTRIFFTMKYFPE
jgi:hypothetical protein